MRKKILIAIFILFSLVFVGNMYHVSARGIVSQGFSKYDNGKYMLIFRTYTSPHSTTVENYYNETINSSYDTTGTTYNYKGKQYSKWKIELEPGNNLPRNDSKATTFSTIRFAFHTSELGTYDDSDNGAYGYNKLNPGVVLDKDLSSINNAYNNSYYKKTNVGTNNNYSSNVYYEIHRLVPLGEYSIKYEAGLATERLYNR